MARSREDGWWGDQDTLEVEQVVIDPDLYTGDVPIAATEIRTEGLPDLPAQPSVPQLPPLILPVVEGDEPDLAMTLPNRPLADE